MTHSNRLPKRSAATVLLALFTATCALAGESPTKSPPADGAAPAKVLDAAGNVVMRRLTQAQYRTIIRDVFGDSIRLGGRFEPDIRVEHLIAVGAGQASITAAGLEQYDKIALSVGSQVIDEAHRDQMIECRPRAKAAPDDACAGRILKRIGRLLFRRPLTERELSAYVAAANGATKQMGDFYQGLSISLAGLLSAPQFLYVQEFSESDPERPGSARLTAYSKAQRLSFLIWNSAPDPMLLDAAESGAIHSEEGLTAQVDRLLASPRLKEGARAFFTDMLEFDIFDTLTKDATLYPKFTSAVALQAQEQTLRTLVQLLIDERSDYREVFTTRRTFLTPLLGAVYRVPVPTPNGLPDEWVPYEFPADSPQAGILSHASFVALHSHPGRSSPTLRGKALRELFLCTKVPDPPANVDFTLVQETNHPTFKTARQRLNAHSNEPMCAGCHKITDPMGFALEAFDTIGGTRSVENGAPIDTRGELNGIKFDDAAGLGKAVYVNKQATACLVRRTFEYAVGRVSNKQEQSWRMQYLEKEFAAAGYRFPALLRLIAISEVYQRVVADPTVMVANGADSQEESK
jgi:hypothetical protein